MLRDLPRGASDQRKERQRSCSGGMCVLFCTKPDSGRAALTRTVSRLMMCGRCGCAACTWKGRWISQAHFLHPLRRLRCFLALTPCVPGADLPAVKPASRSGALRPFRGCTVHFARCWIPFARISLLVFVLFVSIKVPIVLLCCLFGFDVKGVLSLRTSLGLRFTFCKLKKFF